VRRVGTQVCPTGVPRRHAPRVAEGVSNCGVGLVDVEGGWVLLRSIESRSERRSNDWDQRAGATGSQLQTEGSSAGFSASNC